MGQIGDAFGDVTQALIIHDGDMPVRSGAPKNRQQLSIAVPKNKPSRFMGSCRERHAGASDLPRNIAK